MACDVAAASSGAQAATSSLTTVNAYVDDNDEDAPIRCERQVLLVRRSQARHELTLLPPPVDDHPTTHPDAADNDDCNVDPEKAISRRVVVERGDASGGGNTPDISETLSAMSHDDVRPSAPLPRDPNSSDVPPQPASHNQLRAQSVRLLIAVAGIYASYLYYGALQEDVFNYTYPGTGGAKEELGGEDGIRFKQVWFLQAVEAMTCVCVGFLGSRAAMSSAGSLGSPKMRVGAASADNHNSRPLLQPHLPQKPPYRFYFASGATQLLSKFLTASALASGLSFPVATLAKCGKMAPVMAGQYVYGGATYERRECMQVMMIVTGTVMLSLGKAGQKAAGSRSSTSLGLFLILTSLVMDGLTAGLQKRLKLVLAKRSSSSSTTDHRLSPNQRTQKSSIPSGRVAAVSQSEPRPYEFMLYTSLSMLFLSSIAALSLGEADIALRHCAEYPHLRVLIIKFCLCSAIGQSFVFYAVAHFDPLVCSTVTTTRKIASVLISIMTRGHHLSGRGWMGVGLAVAGISGEVHGKVSAARGGRSQSKSKESM